VKGAIVTNAEKGRTLELTKQEVTSLPDVRVRRWPWPSRQER